MNPPRVFISYSHDSAEHKQWILDFATTIRNRGVDAVLDQWDLKPGDDLSHFMETQLTQSQFIIIVCTKEYVEKANAGKGGVGYEKMILTSSLLSRIDSSRVIPIIRQTGTDLRPTFLSSKLYIDFSKDSELEYSLDDLLRLLLNAPLYEKPEIGLNHFKPLEGSRPDRTSDGIKELMKAVASSYEESYEDEGTYEEFTRLRRIVPKVSMHRLTLDIYVKKAINDGLITRGAGDTIAITDKGLEYLVSHSIIEE